MGIYMEKEMRIVNIDDIRIDGGTQCRVVIDQPTVYTYIENMKEGDVFPALQTVFDGSSHWLTDGFHRYHAYKILGIKEIQVDYKPGTLQDAKIIALEANSKHGKPLTNEDKRNKVKMALEIDGFDKKSDREISIFCKVSVSFVSSIRRPEVKEQQKENNEKRIINEAKKLLSNLNERSATTPTEKINQDGAAPDDEEIKASELALEKKWATVHALLESDDEIKTLYDEVERLTLRNAQLETRLNGLMNEKNEVIKMVKQLQKENEKLKAKK